MGIVLFVLFTVVEIALTVATFTAFKTKGIYNRNSLICKAAELIVIIAMIVLPTGNQWRFYVGAVMIVIRLVISGILFLIGRKSAKKDDPKSKIMASLSCVIAVILTFVSLVPAFLFTGYDGLKLTGQYDVKTASAILIDSSRIEEKETDGSNREVPIHFYYPDGDAKDCPFVLFGHGSFGYYQSNSSLYMELASNGYVVASIDHPYYAFFTEDTNGQTIIVDTDFMQTAMNLNGVYEEKGDAFKAEQDWMALRSADVNFALDTVKKAASDAALGSEWFTSEKNAESDILKALAMTDMTKIGVTGHSIGGAVSVEMGRERDDISAVVDIDGTMLGERLGLDENNGYIYNEEPYPVPLLSLENDEHWNDLFKYVNEDGSLYINRYVLNNAVDAYELHYDNTGHMDFTDLPLLSPTLASMFGTGSVDAEEFIPEMNSRILEFFNYYLKGEGELTIDKWDPAMVD